MAEEPQSPDRRVAGAFRPVPDGGLKRMSVVLAAVLVLALAALGVVGAAHLITPHGRPAGQNPSGLNKAQTSGPPSQPAAAVTPRSPGSLANSVIPLAAACRWAYPGQASGKVSGSDYSISCLGPGGQPLGGFTGMHSLNAWCADHSGTDGTHAPSPELVHGTWTCASGQQAAGPSASPSGGQVSVTIPLTTACKWAYPGRASGEVSGSSYAITCLGASGEPLGRVQRDAQPQRLVRRPQPHRQ